MTSSIDRRALLGLGTALAAGATLSAAAPAQSVSPSAMAEHMREMMTIPPDAPTVTLLVYPNMVALDLVGPLTVFKILRCRTELV